MPPASASSAIDLEGLGGFLGTLAVARPTVGLPVAVVGPASVGRLGAAVRLRGLGLGLDRDLFDAAGVFDLLADLEHHVEVLGQELLRLLATLAELLALVGEPRTGL